MNKVIEEKISVEIKKEYDVFVLGGGIAGIAAALAAGRQGKKVLLCEHSYILGGLATSGLIAAYLPLCDGYGKQVSFGIADELCKLSVKYWNDGGPSYEAWIKHSDQPKNEKDPRYQLDYNPSLFALAAEELLMECGVEILYGTLAVSCSMKEDKIESVIVENKSGRYAIGAKSFVDASGDCDLAAFSKTPTINFKQGNILAAWYYFLDNGIYKRKPLGFCDIPDEEKKAGKGGATLLVNCRFLGLSGEELSEMTVMSHKTMFEDIKKQLEGNKENVPVTIPTIPQIRMTRRIDGEVTMTKGNSESYFENSIGLVSHWRCRGPVFEVPFEALYNAKTKNLICAGRNVSNDEYMWDIMRVIPCCAVTGEAAGIAAALTDDFSSLDVHVLQEKLRQNGVVLHK